MTVPFVSLIGAISAVALSSGGTSPMAAEFVHLCGDARGDATQVQRLADAEGWATRLSAPNHQVWGKTREGRKLLLSLGREQVKGRAYGICTVTEVSAAGMRDPADFASDADVLRAWLGVNPIRKDGGDFLDAQFAFRETLHGRSPVAFDPLGDGNDLEPGVTVVGLFATDVMRIMVYERML